LRVRHHREPRRHLHPERRRSAQAAHRAGSDRLRPYRETRRTLRPAHREASLIMSAAVEEAVTEAPAVEAVPKRAMTLGVGTSLVALAVLLIVPAVAKHFVVFQMTMLLDYALAVLALNILTGGSGQFSLGQSAFYAIGAYAAGVLIEQFNVNYALTIP